MDKFKYTVMIETLSQNPSNIDIDDFEEACITFGREELDEIFYTLSDRDNWPPDDAAVVMQMLQVLWHYR